MHAQVDAPTPTEIIVALDVPSVEMARTAIESLPNRISWYKIGLELFCAEGAKVVKMAKNMGKNVFLDLKLHDIPQTVASTIQVLNDLGADLLTVHALGGKAMLSEAANAARKSTHRPKIVAVTTLTSLSISDLQSVGIQRNTQEQALVLGQLALECGIDGLVTSALEAPTLRATLGSRPILVTPGIRLPDDAIGDQQRIATPASAVAAGSNFLVVGRPIMAASDRHAAAERFLREIDLAAARLTPS